MARTTLPQKIQIGSEVYVRIPGTYKWCSDGDGTHWPRRVLSYKNKRWSYEAKTHRRYWPENKTYFTPLEAYNGFWIYQRKRALEEYQELDELFVDEMVANPNPRHPELEGAP